MTATITDFGQFTELRAVAGRDEQAALREVAGQFEALFVETLLKGMRQASLGDGVVGDSDQLAMYQGMLDQQLALEMSSGNGIGLADLLVRQLGAPAETAPRPPDMAISVPGMRGGIQRAAPPEPPGWPDPTEFARDVWPYAERAARLLDVAPEAIVAQAALETGWGEFVMPDSGGDNSFNLFGIKAGSSWRGASVSRNTLEFENGIPHPRQARFRAYADIAATFDDYASFLRDNPRYSKVSGHGTDVAGFAQALQSSGYATDPHYADKLVRVAEGPTMRSVLHDLKNTSALPITPHLSVRMH